MIILISLVLAILFVYLINKYKAKNNTKTLGKFKNILIGIILFFVIGFIFKFISGATGLIKLQPKEIKTVTPIPKTIEEPKSKVIKPITKIEPPNVAVAQSNNNNMPLGTQSTATTGKIYVNIGKYFKGITGISQSNSLMILPELNPSGNCVGSYGVAYYNHDNMTDESLANFSNEIAIKANCNYITLINVQNPNQGIVINASSYGITFTKGTINKQNYTIIDTTELGIINDDKKSIDWQKA